MSKRQNTYILYKIEDITQDLKYIYEFKGLQAVQEYIKKEYNLNNVKDYITKSIENLKPLKNNIVIFKDI